ncbi:basic helix-loop-helix ARNT-like protein 2 [Eucyclogobius newberryi]|uniref:basic helix-loop-helix ARNT-like protein 2 n=1 Tax=Eucyclogobius newberryi TaxID=166745 RepID=UPI003B5CDD69
MSSAAGSGGSTDRPAADAGIDNLEEEGPSLGAFMASGSGEMPRKRKGEVDLRSEPRESDDFLLDEELSRSEGEDQQVKMKCFREPHRQIEKRRRDKMNTLIDELSAMIPSCQPQPRKFDKLTVLRKAVQHLKALRAGSSSAFSESPKPSILPHEDLKHLLLKAVDGFLLVVTCDRAKILFISKSVSQVLNLSRVELFGQSLFDFIHHKDIHKVKEQLASSDSRQSLPDAATPVPLQSEALPKVAHMTTGARRSFFCRMKHSRVSAKQDDKRLLFTSSKKKESYKYCTLHCTGYIGSWPSSELDSDLDPDLEPSPLSCLVTVCRLHPHSQTSKDQLSTKPIEFITRCSIDGKFTFVDHQATNITGYLPQEVLGTSCYEYYHHDDLRHLAEKHREVLRSKEKIETQCYKFKTKYGSYVNLQSQWFGFTNPWTKEIEFIVSLNRVVSRESTRSQDEEEAGSSKAFTEVSREFPIIPGLSSGVGTMIYAGSIGTQIANELTDSYR